MRRLIWYLYFQQIKIKSWKNYIIWLYLFTQITESTQKSFCKLVTDSQRDSQRRGYFCSLTHRGRTHRAIVRHMFWVPISPTFCDLCTLYMCVYSAKGKTLVIWRKCKCFFNYLVFYCFFLMIYVLKNRFPICFKGRLGFIKIAQHHQHDQDEDMFPNH